MKGPRAFKTLKLMEIKSFGDRELKTEHKEKLKRHKERKQQRKLRLEE